MWRIKRSGLAEVMDINGWEKSYLDLIRLEPSTLSYNTVWLANFETSFKSILFQPVSNKKYDETKKAKSSALKRSYVTLY